VLIEVFDNHGFIGGDWEEVLLFSTDFSVPELFGVGATGCKLLPEEGGAGAQPWVGKEGIPLSASEPCPHTREPYKRALLETEILLSFISCLGDWSQTIPQVKKTDMEVLGWRQRRLMVEKLTLNYLAKALVGIPTVSIPIAHSLKT
jgi:hypothetical protein